MSGTYYPKLKTKFFIMDIKQALWITGAVVLGLVIYFMFVKNALKISAYEEGYDRV